jgi:hypothetical protein
LLNVIIMFLLLQLQQLKGNDQVLFKWWACRDKEWVQGPRWEPNGFKKLGKGK